MSPARAEVYRLPEASANTSQTPRAIPRPAEPKAAGWVEWIRRLVAGELGALYRPRWSGSWPRSDTPWNLTLEMGLQGRVDVGFGPHVTAFGDWSLGSMYWNGKLGQLLTPVGGATTWELSMRVSAWSLRYGGWWSPGLRMGDQSVTGSYRRSF